MKQITVFDKTKEFESELSEKVHEIEKLCNLMDIPVFMTFCTKNTETETRYETRYISPGQKQQNLKKDHFPDFINVLNGFHTTPFDEEVFDM